MRGPARCRAAARRAGRCAGVRPRPMCVGPARRAATGGGAGIQIGWAMAEMWHVRCECIARRSGAPRALAPLSLSLALFFYGYITVISIFCAAPRCIFHSPSRHGHQCVLHRRPRNFDAQAHRTVPTPKTPSYQKRVSVLSARSATSEAVAASSHAASAAQSAHALATSPIPAGSVGVVRVSLANMKVGNKVSRQRS